MRSSDELTQDMVRAIKRAIDHPSRLPQPELVEAFVASAQALRASLERDGFTGVALETKLEKAYMGIARETIQFFHQAGWTNEDLEAIVQFILEA